MIAISKTFEIVTPESAEHGDAESRGFEFKDEPTSFRELVDLMKEHPQGSSSPCSGDVHAWFTSYGETCYKTGEERTTSIHFSRINKPRHAKYWRKAAIEAGNVKS